MQNRLKNCLCFIAFILWATSIKAQDTLNIAGCDCSRPDSHAPIGVMIDHAHAKGTWMLSYRYVNTMFHGNIAGNGKATKEDIYRSYIMATDRMSMQMHMFMAMYGVTNRLTVMGMVHYMHHTMNMSMMMYGGNHAGHTGGTSLGDMEMSSASKSGGIGDTKAYILYTLIDKQGHQLLLSGGLSIPTGSVSLYGNNMMGERQKYTYSMQTGTGSFGFLPGVTYTGQSSFYSWGAQVTADIKAGRNKAGYKTGNELIATSWISRRWNSWLSNSLRLSVSASGRIQGFDPEIAPYRSIDPDANTSNSGGAISAAYAGINIVVPSGIFEGQQFGVEYGIPFYQYANGLQMRRTGALYAGWQYSF